LATKHEHSVTSVVFSPDGKRVISFSPKHIHICDADTGTEVQGLRGDGV
jgi:WD40 repeat protein